MEIHFPSNSDDFNGFLSGSHHEWFVESIDISFELFFEMYAAQTD